MIYLIDRAVILAVIAPITATLYQTLNAGINNDKVNISGTNSYVPKGTKITVLNLAKCWYFTLESNLIEIQMRNFLFL